MHVSVQKFTRTTRPRSSAGDRGSELIHCVAPSSDGMWTFALTVPGSDRERRVGVVVHARAGDPSGGPPGVDGDAGLGRELRPAPADDVVLQGARAPVVGERAVLQLDAAAVGEEPLVERDQLVVAPV